MDRAVHSLEQQLRKAEQDLAVHLVIRAHTDAERELVEERDAPVNLVWGCLPLAWRQGAGGPLRLHKDLDERGKRLAAHIAKRIAQDPSIIDRAIEWIDQRDWAEPDPSKRELEERCSRGGVTRRELEHAIRAACDVADDAEVWVFG